MQRQALWLLKINIKRIKINTILCFFRECLFGDSTYKTITKWNTVFLLVFVLPQTDNELRRHSTWIYTVVFQDQTWHSTGYELLGQTLHDHTLVVMVMVGNISCYYDLMERKDSDDGVLMK